MPILSTIADLFKSGIVSVAEQFIRGFTAIKSFSDLMSTKIGDNYQVSPEDQNEFLMTVSNAAVPASQMQAGNIVDTTKLPTWLESPFSGEIIQTGLATVNVSPPNGGEGFTTHIPFTFHNIEAYHYQQVLDNILAAVYERGGPPVSFYEPDIDRLDQAIRYHTARGGNTSITAELYSMFYGE